MQRDDELTAANKFLDGLFQDMQEKILPKKLFPKLSTAEQETQQRMLDELPLASRNAMAIAAKKGWFIGWTGSLGGVVRLTRKIETLDDEHIDAYVADTFRREFDLCSTALLERYPARACAIGPAVRAHARGTEDDFSLSIPVFIAQADGLLSEILGQESVLQSARKVPGIIAGETCAAYLLRTRDLPERDRLLLGSIENIHHTDFLMSSGARKKNERKSGSPFTALNRHQILHGEISNYGTELNSLKAFSFLYYVGLHVPQFINAPLAADTP